MTAREVIKGLALNKAISGYRIVGDRILIYTNDQDSHLSVIEGKMGVTVSSQNCTIYIDNRGNSHTKVGNPPCHPDVRHILPVLVRSLKEANNAT